MATVGSPDRLWTDAADCFARWRDGDPASMEDLVRLLSPVLWQVARAQSLDEETAADVVQTAWLALVRNPDAVREPSAIGGWLATTTRREAWRVGRRTGPVQPVATDELPDRPAPSAEVEATQLIRDRELWDALRRLTERCQRLLRVAAFLDRPDYARLAEELDMPVGSIGPTRGRCLAKLRNLLEPTGGLDD